MTAITTAELTEGTLNGSGLFDVLMETTRVHLENEYKAGRIKGSDYATVYVSAMNNTMQQAIAFLLGKQQADKQAELLAAQALKVAEDKNLVTQQIANLVAEGANIPKQGALIDAQKLKVDADELLVDQQKTNLIAEALNIPKQGALLDSQKAKVDADKLLTDAQELKVDAEKLVVDQQKVNLISTELKIDAETANLTQRTTNLVSDKAKTDAEKLLVDQNAANALTTNTTMVKQQNKLDAEVDVLTEKKWNEQAQRLDTVNTLAVDGVLGKQKALYTAQTDGFARDAEQKLAKMMTDAWAVQRTTDNGISANATNKLDDANVGAVIAKAKAGIGA